VRNIDWNVTARYNEPFVKVFEEERELTLMLMVDISGSEFFGTQEQFKNEIITEIAATLAFSAMQNNDKTGLILFSDEIELYIPPKKGKSHVLRIIRELIEFKPKSNKTDIANALKFLSSVMKKKAIVFVLSDFIADGYRDTLKIAAKKHDVTGIRIYDKAEENIPNLGMVQMEDQETGELLLVNTGSKNVRNQYYSYHRERVDYFNESFTKSGAGALSTRVDEGYVKKLLGYFKRR
ncbi:MAG: VWA domain-containing protein, partial [Aequorivita vladivostokensis]|nr:VWA domain-containing protein [Aequorivita vladivostokensis]